MASIIKVDQIQTAAGGTPTAADLGITGSTLQAKNTVVRGRVTGTNYSTAVDTGLSVTLTPHSASSKFVIIVHCHLSCLTQLKWAAARLMRNGVSIDDLVSTASTSTVYSQIDGHYRNNATITAPYNITGSVSQWAYTMYNQSITYVDAPNTTSDVTYALYAYGRESGTTWALNGNPQDNVGGDHVTSGQSSITVLEIAG